MSVTLGNTVLVHEDERRAIYEMNSLPGGFSVQLFTIKAAIPLGNHFHKRKSEVFTILHGGGILVAQKVDPRSGAPMEGTREFMVVRTGAVVRIPSYTAHTFVLEPDSRMHCCSDAAYRESDGGDMHKLVLVQPEEAREFLLKLYGPMSNPPPAPVGC